MSIKTVNSKHPQLDARRFRELHDKYRERLLQGMLGFLRNRDAAEDVTAVAFAAAFENLGQFRGDSSFYTWLYKIALNEARNRARCKPAVSLDAVDGLQDELLKEPDLVAQTLERSESGAQLQNALRGVPAMYRRTLVSHFVDGDPVAQIARRDRVPVGTVLSRIFTAKRLLRRAWEAKT
jgi:RNA polymerase sigma-70 factor (ECF subfamily)